MYSELDKCGQVIPLDGSKEISPELVGAKAVGIDTMYRLGLPVPPAFALSIDLCDEFQDRGELPSAIWSEVERQVRSLKRRCSFNDPERPLLVSVRSSGLQSMPGMLDTVLNVEVPVAGSMQLRNAIQAVVDSWTGNRAQTYRHWAGIADRPGTGVIIQVMVFGDRDPQSGSGVAAVAEQRLVGEWLEGAQGDVLMAGAASPAPIEQLTEAMPDVASQLTAWVTQLQDELETPVEVEFTVERGKVFLLQVRPVSFLPRAVAAESAGTILVAGVPASPGVGSGTGAAVVPDPERRDTPEPTVLIKRTTAPADVPEMLAAEAVVTEHGGFTSHAAVICREARIPCVVGCGAGTLGLLGRRVAVDGSAGIVRGGAS